MTRLQIKDNKLTLCKMSFTHNLLTAKSITILLYYYIDDYINYAIMPINIVMNYILLQYLFRSQTVSTAG